MATDKPELSIEEEARRDIKLLNDPIIRSFEMARAGLYIGPSLSLGETWNNIGSSVSEEERIAWENEGPGGGKNGDRKQRNRNESI